MKVGREIIVWYNSQPHPYHSRHDHGKTAAALHILVKEEKLALDLLEQIREISCSFGKLAKKHSTCHQANAAAI